MAPTRLHKLLPVILARAATPEKQPFIIQQQSMSSNQKSLLVRSERAPFSDRCWSSVGAGRDNVLVQGDHG